MCTSCRFHDEDMGLLLEWSGAGSDYMRRHRPFFSAARRGQRMGRYVRFVFDAATVDERTLLLRALWHDAISFSVNSAPASEQAARRDVDGGKLLLARVRSQCCVLKRVGVSERFGRLCGAR